MTENIEALPAGFSARRLSRADAEAGFLLSAEAGWNQSLSDWRFLLERGEGIGIEDSEKNLVGTTIVLGYRPRTGWVSMVLVTPAQRKQGFARRMMHWGIDRLEAQGFVPALDATPAGREVYSRLGFVDGPSIIRLEGPAVPVGARADGIEVAPLRDPAEIAALDEGVFAADRSAVLENLLERTPAFALTARRGGVLAGYVLGRVGHLACEIGPIVADGTATALALFDAVSARIEGRPVFLDVFDAQAAFRDALLAAGYRKQRPYSRMSLGALPLGRQDLAFAPAGPELG